jgi:hypothetical protein
MPDICAVSRREPLGNNQREVTERIVRTTALFSKVFGNGSQCALFEHLPIWCGLDRCGNSKNEERWETLKVKVRQLRPVKLHSAFSASTTEITSFGNLTIHFQT